MGETFTVVFTEGMGETELAAEQAEDWIVSITLAGSKLWGELYFSGSWP